MSRADAAFVDAARQFADARQAAREIAETADPEALARRPPDGGWSAAECVAHLNLTAEAFLPLLSKAVDDLKARGLVARRRPRRDLVGWMLSWTLEPPVRMRAKTSAPFVPGAAEPTAVFAEFDRVQTELIALVEPMREFAIDRAIIRSPFDARIRYNAWSAVLVLAAHQRRHLWQARRAIEQASC